MPRKGKGTQPPVAAQGQQYGMASQQIAAQKAIPLPQAPSPADMVMSREQSRGSPPPPTAGQPAPSPAPGGAGLDPAMLMQLAQQQPGPGQGTINEGDVHNEPLTSGMSSGPGPGPEALGYPDMSPILRELARVTGDPRMLQWAQNARLQAR